MFWFETVHPETGEPLEVEAVYYPQRRGLRDRFGAPVEPDDQETVGICEVRNRAGEQVRWDEFQDQLLEAGWRRVEKMAERVAGIEKQFGSANLARFPPLK